MTSGNSFTKIRMSKNWPIWNISIYVKICRRYILISRFDKKAGIKNLSRNSIKFHIVKVASMLNLVKYRLYAEFKKSCQFVDPVSMWNDFLEYCYHNLGVILDILDSRIFVSQHQSFVLLFLSLPSSPSLYFSITFE